MEKIWKKSTFNSIDLEMIKELEVSKTGYLAKLIKEYMGDEEFMYSNTSLIKFLRKLFSSVNIVISYKFDDSILSYFRKYPICENGIIDFFLSEVGMIKEEEPDQSDMKLLNDYAAFNKIDIELIKKWKSAYGDNSEIFHKCLFDHNGGSNIFLPENIILKNLTETLLKINIKKIVVGVNFLDISNLILKNDFLVLPEKDNALIETFSFLEIPDISQKDEEEDDDLSNKAFALKYVSKIVNGEFPVQKNTEFMLSYNLETGYFDNMIDIDIVDVCDLYPNILLMDYETFINAMNLY